MRRVKIHEAAGMRNALWILRSSGVLILASVAALGLAMPASGQEPAPDFASGDLLLRPEGGDATKPRLESGREYGPAVATVFLRNPGKKRVTVRLTAWLLDGQRLPIESVEGPGINVSSTARDDTVILDDKGNFDLKAHSVTPVSVSFVQLTKSSSTSGQLVLGGPSVAQPDTVGITIERPTPPWYIWTPLLVGLALSGLLIGVRWLTLRKESPPNLAPLPKWTFKDGWASNVVVIGAVVAALLAAVSSLGPNPFGDFAVAKFVGLNLIFGALVLLAPLAYSTMRTTAGNDSERRTAGTVAGFMIASLGTVWAAFGQLSSLLILVSAAPHSILELVTLGALLLVAALFVAVYAWRTIAWTVRGYAEAEPPAPGQPKTQPLL